VVPAAEEGGQARRPRPHDGAPPAAGRAPTWRRRRLASSRPPGHKPPCAAGIPARGPPVARRGGQASGDGSTPGRWQGAAAARWAEQHSRGRPCGRGSFLRAPTAPATPPAAQGARGRRGCLHIRQPHPGAGATGVRRGWLWEPQRRTRATARSEERAIALPAPRTARRAHVPPAPLPHAPGSPTSCGPSGFACPHPTSTPTPPQLPTPQPPPPQPYPVQRQRGL
jgi:hypothetical protein